MIMICNDGYHPCGVSECQAKNSLPWNQIIMPVIMMDILEYSSSNYRLCNYIPVARVIKHL